MNKTKTVYCRFLLEKSRRETMSQQARDLFERLWNEYSSTGRSPAFHSERRLAHEAYMHRRELPLAREELIEQRLIEFTPDLNCRDREGRPVQAGYYSLTAEALRESNEVVSSARRRGVISN